MLITAISAQNPARVTVTGHNSVTGQVVAIDSTNSTPPLSGDYVCTVIDANTFSVPVNVTGSGNMGNAYPVLFCSYEDGNNANSGITYALRFKDLTNGATAARLFPGYQVRIKASPNPTSLGQTATWTDGPLPATIVPVSSTAANPIVMTLSAGHGLVTGDTIIVNGHNGNLCANGVWSITVSTNAITLLNADGSNSLGTTSGNSPGGVSGTVRKITNSVVKLTTSVTKNIAGFGNTSVYATNAWTASTNVTTDTAAIWKEGWGSPRITIAAAFTTGLAAYYPTGTLDLSGYQQVSFWIYQFSGTLGAASSCSLALCSDTAGTTVVNTINIPVLGALGRWSPITVDLGTNLGSSIKSIAFIVNTDNGAQQFYIDNIIACKASSSADSLSLTSLISKNTGTEGWYGIQSINGTRVILDQDTNCVPAATSSRGYSGTTETVTTYKKETTKTAMAVALATVIQQIMDSGTDGNPITFSGGWNRTDMSTQTGETIFDGQNGWGYGIYLVSINFINLSISAVRYSNGILLNNAYINTILVNNANNNAYSGVYSTVLSSNKITVINANNNLITGIYNVTCSNQKIISVNTNNNAGPGVTLYSSSSNNKVVASIGRNNTCAASLMLGTSNNFCSIADSSGNSTASIITDSMNYLTNSTLNSSVKVSLQYPQNYMNNMLWSTNENGNTDTHFGYTDGGLISSDITTVHTAGGMSWKLSPTSANRAVNYPLPLKVATGATPANTPITCSVWFMRDNTGLTARLICRANQLTGIPTDIITNASAAANVWEKLSVVVTPTQKGVLEFYAEAWGGTSWNCWVDEPSFS